MIDEAIETTMEVGRIIEVRIVATIEITVIVGTTGIGEITEITGRAEITGKDDSEMIRYQFLKLIIYSNLLFFY